MKPQKHALKINGIGTVLTEKEHHSFEGVSSPHEVMGLLLNGGREKYIDLTESLVTPKRGTDVIEVYSGDQKELTPISMIKDKKLPYRSCDLELSFEENEIKAKLLLYGNATKTVVIKLFPSDFSHMIERYHAAIGREEKELKIS